MPRLQDIRIVGNFGFLPWVADDGFIKVVIGDSVLSSFGLGD